METSYVLLSLCKLNEQCSRLSSADNRSVVLLFLWYSSLRTKGRVDLRDLQWCNVCTSATWGNVLFIHSVYSHIFLNLLGICMFPKGPFFNCTAETPNILFVLFLFFICHILVCDIYFIFCFYSAASALYFINICMWLMSCFIWVL